MVKENRIKIMKTFRKSMILQLRCALLLVSTFFLSNIISSQSQCHIDLSADSVEIANPVRAKITLKNIENTDKLKIDFSKIKNQIYDAANPLMEEYADISILGTDAAYGKIEDNILILENSRNLPTHFYIDFSVFSVGIFTISLELIANDSLLDVCIGGELTVLMPEVLTQDTSLTIRDISPVKTLETTAVEYIYWVSAVILSILLILMMYFGYKKYFKKYPEVLQQQNTNSPDDIPDYEEEALNRFYLMAERKDWLHGKEKEYHAELTEVLKWYLTKKYNFGALSHTTSEIIDQADQYINNGEDLKLIANVLNVSDMVKFAKSQAATDMNENILAQCIDYIKKHRKDRSLPENEQSL